MPDNRTQVIINEINYWKEHKLLPDVYCDFLLALYTHGEEASHKSYSSKMFLVYTILLIPLTPLSFVVIYITQFSPILQIGILTLFLIFAIWSYSIFKKHQYHFTYLALITMLILILLISLFLVQIFFTASSLTQLIIIINFIGWFILGRKNELKFLTIKSVLAVVFTGIYIVF